MESVGGQARHWASESRASRGRVVVRRRNLWASCTLESRMNAAHANEHFDLQATATGFVRTRRKRRLIRFAAIFSSLSQPLASLTAMRLFVAITLPADVHKRIVRVMEELKP